MYEDNCQYHLGIDHCQDGNRCQDRDSSQNGNEHADDQGQWSALKYNIMIIVQSQYLLMNIFTTLSSYRASKIKV